jgi:rsbT co-antagonist protein RsbR
METVVQLEEILQAAATGDYSKRCETASHAGSPDNPLATLVPSINLLLDDLQAQKDVRSRVEAELRNTIHFLQEQAETIRRQGQAIRRLSTPVLEVWEGIIVLPIIGVVHQERGRKVMEKLLQHVSAQNTRCAILDITGVDRVDQATAKQLVKIVKAAGFLGARCLLTGMSPAVAHTLAKLGQDLSGIETYRSLQEGLRRCLDGGTGPRGKAQSNEESKKH